MWVRSSDLFGDEVNQFTIPLMRAENKNQSRSSLHLKKHNCAFILRHWPHAECIALKNVKNLSQFSASTWTFIIIISVLFSAFFFIASFLFTFASFFFSRNSWFSFFLRSVMAFWNISWCVLSKWLEICFNVRLENQRHTNTWCVVIFLLVSWNLCFVWCSEFQVDGSGDGSHNDSDDASVVAQGCDYRVAASGQRQ